MNPASRLPLVLWVLGLLTLPAFGQAAAPAPLTLGPGDVLIEARNDGYHLFIRQIPGVASVLLTESFEAPDHKLATYALRAAGPNPVNDGEKRLLDGKFLPQPHHSLTSSTVVQDPGLGAAFHVVIPRTVEYGNPAYPDSRYGKTDVQAALAGVGTTFWFSIRTFAKPYADYTGAYKDNAFELRSFLVQRSRPSSDHYEAGLYEGFSRLGAPYPAQGIGDALDRVAQAMARQGDSLDMVLAIDTTKSMTTNLQTMKAQLLGPVRTAAARYKSFRLGLVFYRDYMEDYLTRTVAFTSDLDAVQRSLDQALADGGGDIPEAVVEALSTGLTAFDWKAENRVILLLGDAPQHPAPRGQITEDQVRALARDKRLELQLVMLPQTPGL